jgi:hypothetical protein
MTVQEALTYATLSNNYMAWLYGYKHKNPASTLKTEYNLEEKSNDEEGTDDNNDERIYCADLDEMEIAVVINDAIVGFKLVVVDKSPEEHKAAQEAAEKVRKEALANMSNRHHARSYKNVALMLTNDASSSSDNSPRDMAKEAKKKKQQSMRGLKMYTGSGTKKAEGTATSSRAGWRKARHLL